MLQKRLERSIRLLNDTKKRENRILIFSYENIFTVDPVFNEQKSYVWKLFLCTPQRDINQASSLNHDGLRRSIDQGEYASGLVRIGLQAILCLLQRSFGDESSSMVQEITKKSDYVFQQACTHGKDCAGLLEH